MAKKHSFSIAKIVKVGAEYAMLNVADQVINTMPNIPPAVKALTGVSVAFGEFEILNGFIDTLPPQVRGVAKAINDVQAVLLVVQQIPNIMTALSSGLTTTAAQGV